MPQSFPYLLPLISFGGMRGMVKKVSSIGTKRILLVYLHSILLRSQSFHHLSFIHEIVQQILMLYLTLIIWMIVIITPYQPFFAYKITYFMQIS